MELTRTSMISRLSSSKSVSMHRLVQFAVLSRLSGQDRTLNFDLAVNILYFDFPNTWQQGGAHQGHGWSSWETCSAILPHVSRLMQVSDKYGIKPTKPDMWAELVFRTGTYVYSYIMPYEAELLTGPLLQVPMGKGASFYCPFILRVRSESRPESPQAARSTGTPYPRPHLRRCRATSCCLGGILAGPRSAHGNRSPRVASYS